MAGGGVPEVALGVEDGGAEEAGGAEDEPAPVEEPVTPPGGPLEPAGGTSGCLPDLGVVSRPQLVPAGVKVKP